jgi:adenine phosphoribosyltransferase
MTVTMNELEYVREHVRQVPDFPKPGILFLDITTATKDAKSFEISMNYLFEQFKNKKVDYVAGIESRGFIYGAALANKLNVGFIPIRKPNKLPADTVKESYSLEYGTDTIEMHADAIKEGDRVVIIDDLLATGGTAVAACNLVRKVGGEVVATAFIIELDPLKGREKLEAIDVKVVSMLNYDLD